MSHPVMEDIDTTPTEEIMSPEEVGVTESPVPHEPIMDSSTTTTEKIMSPGEKISALVEIGTSSIPILTSCSLCSTKFPEKDEPLQPLSLEGASLEEGANWKALVFQALCQHLNVKEIFTSVLEHDVLDSTMKAFRLCHECIDYGWRLVVLDQNLTTVVTEINALAAAFRNIIATAITTTTTATTTSLPLQNGENGGDDGEKASQNQDKNILNLDSSLEVVEDSCEDTRGPDYIQEFIKKVTEVLPEPEPVVEVVESAEPEPSASSNCVVDNNDEEQNEEEDAHIPDSTSQVHSLFQEDCAMNFDLMENVTYRIEIPPELSSALSSSINNNINYHNMTCNVDPHWIAVQDGDNQDDHQQQIQLHYPNDVGIQEFVTIGGGGGVGVGIGLISPSPPYSPLSVGGMHDNNNDDDDDEEDGAGLELNVVDVDDDEHEHEHEEKYRVHEVPLEDAVPRVPRPHRNFHYAQDDLFVLKFEPPFAPPPDKNEGKKHKRCGRPRKSSADKAAELEGALRNITPRLKSIRKVKGLGTLLGEKKKKKRKKSTTSKIKKPKGRPRKNLSKNSNNNNNVPLSSLYSDYHKILATLDPIDVEGFETMCRMGLGHEFKRLKIKLHHCSDDPVVIVDVGEEEEGRVSPSATSSSSSSPPVPPVCPAAAAEEEVQEEQDEGRQQREITYSVVQYDELFDVLVPMKRSEQIKL